jgi:hypothetical protein
MLRGVPVMPASTFDQMLLPSRTRLSSLIMWSPWISLTSAKRLLKNWQARPDAMISTS